MVISKLNIRHWLLCVTVEIPTKGVIKLICSVILYRSLAYLVNIKRNRDRLQSTIMNCCQKYMILVDIALVLTNGKQCMIYFNRYKYLSLNFGIAFPRSLSLPVLFFGLALLVFNRHMNTVGLLIHAFIFVLYHRLHKSRRITPACIKALLQFWYWRGARRGWQHCTTKSKIFNNILWTKRFFIRAVSCVDGHIESQKQKFLSFNSVGLHNLRPQPG